MAPYHATDIVKVRDSPTRREVHSRHRLNTNVKSNTLFGDINHA